MTQEWVTPIPIPTCFYEGGREAQVSSRRVWSWRCGMPEIEKYNLVQVSGILPTECKTITVQEGMRRLTPGQVVFGNMSESSTDEPNRLLCAGLGVAMPVKDQSCGYISEHHGYGLTEERIRGFCGGHGGDDAGDDAGD